MYYVYILKNKGSGKYYIGYTTNLERRIAEHNEGRSRWTRIGKGKWMLMYCEEFEDKSRALKREKELKKKKSRMYIEHLINRKRIDKINKP
jgi:putative endonuclease